LWTHYLKNNPLIINQLFCPESMRYILLLLSILFFYTNSFTQNKTQNIVLITLDGMRWQEVFGGAVDSLINNKAYTENPKELFAEFYNEDIDKRRRNLMPFFWNVIAKDGQLYGNRWRGSEVDVANSQWFSYPGYNEILTGAADPDIRSNKKIYNSNVTVLEWLAKQPGFENKVAAFGSWDVIPYIINDKRCGFPVNAGFDTVSTGNISAREHFLNDLMDEIPSPFSSVRLDAFTHHYALEYMKREKPRILYIAYGETDDFAHDGKYDYYLKSANKTDKWIESIWNYIQSDNFYRNKTTLFITTDHGRGISPMSAWTDHGSDVPHASEIWCAVIGPDTKALGEVVNSEPIFAKQFAPTLAGILGFQYKAPSSDAGIPVKKMLHE